MTFDPSVRVSLICSEPAERRRLEPLVELVEHVLAAALGPEVLRHIVRVAIEREIDPGRLARTRRVEAAERETLARVVGELEASA